jgi:hypothetical protein
VLFPPVAQTFSLVPNEQRLRCADKSVCGHGSNGPLARADQPQRIAGRAAQCRDAVRPCGTFLWVRAHLPPRTRGLSGGICSLPLVIITRVDEVEHKPLGFAVKQARFCQ